MWGQWIGSGGDREAALATTVTLNIDRDRQGFGRLLMFGSVATKQSALNATVVFRDGVGKIDHVISSVPGVLTGPFSAHDLSLEASGQDCILKWVSPNGQVGQVTLLSQEQDNKTTADRTLETWAEFQGWVSEVSKRDRRLIFRGQTKPWPLRTSFHRTGRRDLDNYAAVDIPRLQNVVAAAGHDWVMQLNDEALGASTRGSLLALGQHHGFPTPFIDWTESPYIAAFFAFGETPSSDTDSTSARHTHVRIFCLDCAVWH